MEKELADGNHAPIRLAFIGFGEAGSTIAAGFIAAGQRNVRAFDILIDQPERAADVVKRAASVGVDLCATGAEAVAGADIIFSLVTADQCRVAAQQLASHLQAGQFWLDMNSTSPLEKAAASELIAASGARYVDAAVMDNVPGHGHRVPILLAGKAAPAALAITQRLGMNTRHIGDTIGQAATIKMCRSVFLKGLEASLVECLSAASKADVLDQVIASIDHTFGQLKLAEHAGERLARSARHAKRRAEEMRAATQTLRDLGIRPVTASATAERLQALADSGVYDELLADGQPASVADILAILNDRMGSPS